MFSSKQNFLDPASPIFLGRKIRLWLPKVYNKSKKFDLLKHFGPVAHLVEHIICNDGVAGSSPVGSTEKSPPCADFFVTRSKAKLYVRTRTDCRFTNSAEFVDNLVPRNF